MAAMVVAVLALMGLSQCPKELAQEMFIAHGRRPESGSEFDALWKQYRDDCDRWIGDGWEVSNWEKHWPSHLFEDGKIMIAPTFFRHGPEWHHWKIVGDKKKHGVKQWAVPVNGEWPLRQLMDDAKKRTCRAFPWKRQDVVTVDGDGQ